MLLSLSPARPGLGVIAASLLFTLIATTAGGISGAAASDKAPEAAAIATVLVGNNEIHATATGPPRAGSELQVDTDSLFHIGSNTKAMTATMLAMLVEEGLLGWETTVSDVWPGQVEEMHEEMRDVSLHELLTHRSGIRAFTDGRDWRHVPELEGDERSRRIAFSLWLLGQEPEVRRGLYHYSNAGYSVASAMVEELSGQSWQELMQERIFDPLGMHVQVGWPLDHGQDEPVGYMRRFGLPLPYGRKQGYSLPAEIAPAGDLSMSMPDYGKFLQLHLDGLTGDPRLLSAESFAFLHEPVGHYACGWIVLDRESILDDEALAGRVSSHDGSAGTFYIHAELDQSRQIAAAAVINIGGDKSRELTEGLVQELLRQDEAAIDSAALNP